MRSHSGYDEPRQPVNAERTDDIPSVTDDPPGDIGDDTADTE